MKIVLSVGALACLGIAAWFFMNLGYDITNSPPKNEIIVAFGDSLVEGVGSERGGGFVSMLSEQLGRPIINMGVSGNTTSDGLVRLPDVRSKTPGTVILLLGGNDAIRRMSREETFSNLERIIRTLQGDGAMVVLLGVRGGLIGDPYDDEYEALAARTGSLYVENVLKGLIGRNEYMYDAIHPNDAGYAVIADRVAKALLPHLGEEGR